MANEDRFFSVRMTGDCWTVGEEESDGSWTPQSDHDSPEAAGDQAAWLNRFCNEEVSA